jgi:hypothetical protein
MSSDEERFFCDFGFGEDIGEDSEGPALSTPFSFLDPLDQFEYDLMRNRLL